MPLDGISAKCLALELNHQLQDARIDRIYQPERTDILLIVRARQENLRLLLSANPAAPRIHLTREVRENPAEPPMFCMLLRKYLSGARIMSVETPDYERIFIIRLATQNELGDTLEKKLVVEIMGRHSNIILLNQDLKIHDAIVHVDPSISRLREIMPARTYQLPQNQHKAAPDVVLAQLRAGQFSLQPAQAAATLDKALLEMIQGFSPQLCQSVVIRAGLNIRQNPCQLSETAQQALLSSLGATLEQIVAGQFQPTTYYRRPQDTSPYDYHALRLVSLANPRSETSLSDAMDRYYLEQTRQNRLAQQRQALLRQIEALLESTGRKLAIHQAELAEGQKRDEYRKWGELLTSQLDLVPEGQPSVELIDYFDPHLPRIQLQLVPNLTPSQNARRYFRLYQKARGKFEINTRLIQEDEAAINWLNSLRSAIVHAQDETDILAIREELNIMGLDSSGHKTGRAGTGESDGSIEKPTEPGSHVRDLAPGKPSSRTRRQALARQQSHAPKTDRKKKPPSLPPRSFVSSDGFLIQAGRNNLQNDHLTLRTAQKDDLWFHARNVPGTHVIVRCGRQPVPERTIEEAAQIAAWYSEASVTLQNAPATGSDHAHKVPVDYCPVSQVRKIAGGKPGLVQYDHYRTILVQPRNPAEFLKPEGQSGSAEACPDDT